MTGSNNFWNEIKGGLPAEFSTYVIGAIDQNNGSRDYAIYLKEPVPVNAFWSITVYDEEGHLFPSPPGFPKNINRFLDKKNTQTPDIS